MLEPKVEIEEDHEDNDNDYYYYYQALAESQRSATEDEGTNEEDEEAEEADDDYQHDFRNCRRSAILDEHYTQIGDLLACNREKDDSVTSCRMPPYLAAVFLDYWISDQWEEHLTHVTEDAERHKHAEDERRSRRAALARHLGSLS